LGVCGRMMSWPRTGRLPRRRHNGGDIAAHSRPMHQPVPRFIAAAFMGWTLAFSAPPAAAAPARLLIFGEQHDQPDQQRQVAAEVLQLAADGRLAALVLEMAERPHHTSTLTHNATEADARAALQWNGWPWDAYAAVVMNAVRAGVPVWGGNLPRAGNRAAMADTALDGRVADSARQSITEAVRNGHCKLLPASQEPGMVRIQIARDRAMAEVVATALHKAPPGSTVLLLTGAQHASRDRGVPLHLQQDAGIAAADIRVLMFGERDDGLLADEWRAAVVTPQEDHCEVLRKRLAASAPAR
jgi:uncharacterized iron-regulated protein